MQNHVQNGSTHNEVIPPTTQEQPPKVVDINLTPPVVESPEIVALKAQLAAVLEQNKALKDLRFKGVTMKASEKGALSLYGVGRFPATFYASQWESMLAAAKEIQAFIDNARKQPKDVTTGLQGGLSFDKRSI